MEFKVVDLSGKIVHESDSVSSVWSYLKTQDRTSVGVLSVKEYEEGCLMDVCGALFILNKFKSENLIPKNVSISEL